MMSGSARRIFNIAAGDIRLTFKERSIIIWAFLMPLAFMFFFGISFSSGGSKGVPKATITIENRDTGFLSRDLIEALKGENLNIVDSLPEGVIQYARSLFPKDLPVIFCQERKRSLY